MDAKLKSRIRWGIIIVPFILWFGFSLFGMVSQGLMDAFLGLITVCVISLMTAVPVHIFIRFKYNLRGAKFKYAWMGNISGLLLALTIQRSLDLAIFEGSGSKSDTLVVLMFVSIGVLFGFFLEYGELNPPIKSEDIF